MYKRSSFWVFILIALTAWAPAHAENKFDDLSGRFTIDLPDSYELAPQQFETFYMFGGDGGQIIGFFEDGSFDLDAAYNSAKENFNDLLTDVKTLEFVTLETNGKPAKMGVYRGMAESDGQKAVIYTVVISAILDNGSLYFTCIMSEGAYGKWGDAVKKSFKSIREVGTPATGVRNVKPAG